MNITYFLKFAGYLLVTYAVLLTFLYFVQEKLQFYPDTRRITPAEIGYPVFSPITVKTDDGLELEGWYSPAQPGMPTLLVFHGNGGAHGWRAAKFAELVDIGHGVLIAGYRGYGGNPGSPDEAGLYRDASAYAAFLASQNIPPQMTVYYGESLGTGIAIETATKHPDIAGMILEAPYTSFPALASYHYRYLPLISLVVRNRFASIDKIDKLTMPKLFLMGERDRVVPPAFTRELYERARQPKGLQTYPKAGHNDITPSAMADIQAFLTH